MLLAMATGTGKTKTCIALIYRLLKVKRFRRVLFLVDRSALVNRRPTCSRHMCLLKRPSEDSGYGFYLVARAGASSLATDLILTADGASWGLYLSV